jgi:hypothetical protein
LGEISGQLNYLNNFSESFFQPRADDPSQNILFGNPFYQNQLPYIPYFHLDGQPIKIQTAKIESSNFYSDVSDVYVEKPKTNLPANLWVTVNEVKGVYLGSGFDLTTASPRFIRSPSPEKLLANPYINTVTGINNGQTIILGHKFLSNQFQKGLITLLEKPDKEAVPLGFGQAVWFDGRGVIQVPHHQSLETPKEFTIELRFKWMGQADNEVLVWKEDKDYLPSYRIGKLTNNRISFRLWNGQKYSPKLFTSPIKVNRWYHLAAVVQNETISLYLDGQLQGKVSFQGPVAFSDQPLYLGGQRSNSFNFSGFIDEVRISKTARYKGNFSPSKKPFIADSDTALLLHLDNNARDSSLNQNNGQLTGIYDFIGHQPGLSPTPSPQSSFPFTCFWCGSQCTIFKQGMNCPQVMPPENCKCFYNSEKRNCQSQCD